MTQGMKAFFKPLQRKRFWIGFSAGLLIVPVITTVFFLIIGLITDSFDVFLSMSGLAFMTGFYGALYEFTPLVLVSFIFENRNIRSKTAYLNAAVFIIILYSIAVFFIIEPYSFDKLVNYLATHILLNVLSAYVFWRIAVKPLENK